VERLPIETESGSLTPSPAMLVKSSKCFFQRCFDAVARARDAGQQYRRVIFTNQRKLLP
jgi:hypothetical protein